MSLSVIIPTFNERDPLHACLDALAGATSGIEVIVVNAPSTDGTSGMIHERDDVSVLIECTSRNVNVARNAGIRMATGGVIAILGASCRVRHNWQQRIEDLLSGAADTASGPVREIAGEVPSFESDEVQEIEIHGENVAFSRSALTALDGFDEYLEIGGTRDMAQRIKGQGLHAVWDPEMAVERIDPPSDSAAGNHDHTMAFPWWMPDPPAWGPTYRARTYRTVKNGGGSPRVLLQLGYWALRDAGLGARDVLRGEGTPTQWVGNGIEVCRNTAIGFRDGLAARRADGTAARNPQGLSHRHDPDPIEEIHDWRG